MLNVSINSIWRNFLDRGFFVFRWVKKKVLLLNFGHFCPDLKHNFNIWFFRVMLGQFWPFWCHLQFSHRLEQFSENFLNKNFSFIVGQHFFVAATNTNKKTTNVKKLRVVAFGRSNKYFYRYVFYYHVGAHLKNFWRARAATHWKNCLNIK